MIGTDARTYDYRLINPKNAYGQTTVGPVVGQIKMTINITSQSVQDNINYAEAQYVGLTYDNVDDTYIIDYYGRYLKVLYVNSMGRMKQVFMKSI